MKPGSETACVDREVDGELCGSHRDTPRGGDSCGRTEPADTGSENTILHQPASTYVGTRGGSVCLSMPPPGFQRGGPWGTTAWASLQEGAGTAAGGRGLNTQQDNACK